MLTHTLTHAHAHQGLRGSPHNCVTRNFLVWKLMRRTQSGGESEREAEGGLGGWTCQWYDFHDEFGSVSMVKSKLRNFTLNFFPGFLGGGCLGERETPTSIFVVVEISSRKLNFKLWPHGLQFSFWPGTKLETSSEKFTISTKTPTLGSKIGVFSRKF